MMRVAFLAVGSLMFVGAACGGRVIYETPLGAGGAGTGGAGGTTSIVGVGAGTPGTSGVGGAVTDATVGVSTSISSTSISSTSVSSTSVSVSSSSSGSMSASVSSSSSSGGPPVQVACNGGQCNPGEVCCFNPTGPGDHCGTAGQCDPGYVVLSCSGPQDCPGGVCCATQDAMQHYTGVACQTTCAGMNELVVCSKMQQNVCPMGTTCQHSQQLGNGYRVCAP